MDCQIVHNSDFLETAPLHATMPRCGQRNPSALTAICLNHISRHLEYWSAIERPFDCLPCNLQNELINIVLEKCYDHKFTSGDIEVESVAPKDPSIIARFLDQISGPNVDMLTLNKQLKDEFKVVIYNLCPSGPVLKCPNITKLSLPGYSGSLKQLRAALSQLGKLDALNLDNTQTNDAVLDTIATCCPHMRTLYVENTLTTVSGIAHILRHNKFLRRVKSEHLVEAVTELFRMKKKGQYYGHLKLTHGEIPYSMQANEPIPIKPVRKYLRHCPDVKKLRIRADILGDFNVLNSVKSLKALTHFAVRAYDCDFAPFMDVALLSIGRNLLKLKLWDYNIDPVMLSIQCPNLQALEVDNCIFKHFSSITGPNDDAPLTELKELFVTNCDLWSNPWGKSATWQDVVAAHGHHLERLSVTSDKSGFDDEGMDRMCQGKPFEELSDAYFEMHSLSIEGWWRFITHCPSLSTLTIVQSKSNPPTNTGMLKKRIAEQNWELSIHIYASDSGDSDSDD